MVDQDIALYGFYVPFLKQALPAFSMCEFQTLSACDLRDPAISALIAAKLKEFHSLEMPGSKNVCLWVRLRYVPLPFPFLLFCN